jgi:Zn-dependent protease
MDQAFLYWGLPVGRIAGIHVRVHWLLLLYWASQLNSYLRAGIDSRAALLAWALGAALFFGSVLLHELGHAFAARRVGGRATEILLWPLGGLAYCVAPETWRAQLAVAAGGPLVTLGIALVSFAAFTLGGALLDGLTGTARLAAIVSEEVLVDRNFYLLVLNLIPLYPLDGGRIVHASVWGFWTWRGALGAHGRALRLTVWASRVTAAAGIVWCIHSGDIALAVVFLYLWGAAEALRR